MAKEKTSLIFFALTHTNYHSQRQQHFTLSFLFSSPRTALSLLVVFFFSKRLPLGCFLFFLVQHLFLYFLQYATILLVTALSSLAIFSKAATLYSLLLLAFLPSENIFFSLGFTLYFPSPHRENLWIKTIKFFVALSIYKLFSYYLLDYEYITSLIRNRLFFHNKKTQINLSFFN